MGCFGVERVGGAVERHIEVGDGLQIMVITKEGIEEIYMPLKKD